MDNITIVRRLFDEVFTGGDVDVLDEFVANNVKLIDPSLGKSSRTGLDTYKSIEANYLEAFPGKKTKIDEIFTAGDKVVVRWTCTGKHEGEFQGISPTHRPFTVSGLSIYKITNGKISEIVQVWDRFGLLEQLGAVQALHYSR